ncbi:MAG: thiamine pyrophosphate-dependent enzyme [Polyangiaceae bacterium]
MPDPTAPDPHPDLHALALRVREHIVRMATGGGCFIGASLSCADLLVWLYARVLDVAPDRVADPNRDWFLLSKGHDVPALYATLAELGWFPKERLANHLSIDDSIYWHPNRAVPGIEFHSGSLGHLLSVGVGVALDLKMRGAGNSVYVLVGDGECDEGSVWEALLVASAHRLDNLVVVVDRNGFQANARTEEVLPLEPFTDKLAAFGCAVRTCDGHDFADLERTFAAPATPGKPTAVVAHTVRGKGLPSIEARADRWFVDFTPDEVQALLAELRGGAAASLASPALHVR